MELKFKIKELIDYSQDFEHSKGLFKEEGIVFTDKDICNIIINRLMPSIDEKICEPSVGKGSFVFNLLEYFLKQGHIIKEIVNFVENNLFCFETNKNIFNEFKLLLSNYFEIYEYAHDLDMKNIFNSDFLETNNNYDVSLGNPPYIRIQNLDKDYLETLKKQFKSISIGNVDIYYAFLEKCLKNSKRIGFIVPNSFFKNKSGNNLRDVLYDRIDYVYDYGTYKVWNKVSTYTCILTCQEKKIDKLTYENKNKRIDISKGELTHNKIWIFNKQEKNHNKLDDMIISISGGLATLKDNIYKIDSFDDNYCYKDGFKIEKEICSKCVKATKTKDYNYNYIIYPYIFSDIIKEEVLIEKFPMCYKYLLSKKTDLSKRDKGKTEKYATWYAYGRKQGLLKKYQGTRFILPLMFLKNNGIHIIEVPKNDEVLVLSGIMIEIKSGFEQEFKDTISQSSFYDYCENNNKVLSDSAKNEDSLWISLTTTSIRNYFSE